MEKNSKVLLTGGRGFLGKYIHDELSKLHGVDTLGRLNSTWNVDLSSNTPVFEGAYDLVVHSAGKAHSIPVTGTERQEFFDVNVKGTQNLLVGLERMERIPQAFVFISSVAVYGLETGENVKEEHPLLASDPYGKSKILAEQLITDWCSEKGVKCSILRLPLIAGENAPGNLQAMIKSIKGGYYFNIGGGRARKSMVLAQDVAGIIMRVAEVGGTYNLTDGYHPTFRELSATISAQLNRRVPVRNMPMLVAQLLGKIGDLMGRRAPLDSLKIKKITADLTFNDDKARKLLNWKPTAVVNVRLL